VKEKKNAKQIKKIEQQEEKKPRDYIFHAYPLLQTLLLHQTLSSPFMTELSAKPSWRMSSPYPSFYKYSRNRSSSDFDIEGDK
jgi:hypothetical protein